jgi:cytochrome c oxidase assembly factor CtaG
MGGELVSAHMLQHELLMVVAAPLLVMGQPLLVGLWALPIGERRRVGRYLARFRRAVHRLGRVEVTWARSGRPCYSEDAFEMYLHPCSP